MAFHPWPAFRGLPSVACHPLPKRRTPNAALRASNFDILSAVEARPKRELANASRPAPVHAGASIPTTRETTATRDVEVARVPARRAAKPHDGDYLEIHREPECATHLHRNRVNARSSRCASRETDRSSPEARGAGPTLRNPCSGTEDRGPTPSPRSTGRSPCEKCAVKVRHEA